MKTRHWIVIVPDGMEYMLPNDLGSAIDHETDEIEVRAAVAHFIEVGLGHVEVIRIAQTGEDGE